MSKKLFFLVLVMVIMSFSFAHAGDVTINLASSFEPAHTTCQAGDFFKELVENRSDGRMKVHTFWGGVMGSEEELCESLSTGGIEMMVGGGIPIKIYAPEYQFMNDPFIMRDWEHWKNVWDGGIGEELKGKIEERGNTKYLEVMYLGVRHFTSNKPIINPEDVKGLKLRLPNLPTWVSIWKTIGALPVPIALNELFSSLQLGVADASEGMLSQISSFHLDEVQDYLSLTGHSIQSGAFTINKQFFNDLSKDDQKLVLNAAIEAAEWATRTTKENESKLQDELKSRGMKIVEANQKAFYAKAKPAVEKLFKEKYTVTTWEEILSY